MQYLSYHCWFYLGRKQPVLNPSPYTLLNILCSKQSISFCVCGHRHTQCMIRANSYISICICMGLHMGRSGNLFWSHRLCRNEELSHKIWNLFPIQLFRFIKSKEISKSSLAPSDSQFPKERATVLIDLNNSQGLESFCLRKTGKEGGRLLLLTKTSKWLLENSNRSLSCLYGSLQNRREPRTVPHFSRIQCI